MGLGGFEERLGWVKLGRRIDIMKQGKGGKEWGGELWIRVKIRLIWVEGE